MSCVRLPGVRMIVRHIAAAVAVLILAATARGLCLRVVDRQTFHWTVKTTVTWALGYNKFDFFLESEEYRPFDGCKIEILDTFNKYGF
jgi:hypothetical protein